MNKCLHIFFCALLCFVSFNANAYTKVNVFYHSLENEFFSCFDFSLKQLGKKDDVRFMVHDAKFDYKRQLSQVTHDIVNAQASIVISSDPIVTKEALEGSRNQNLTVLFFNRKPPITYRSYQKAWFVGTNAKQAGEIQAKLVTDYIKSRKAIVDKNSNNVIDFLMLRGEKNNPDTVERTTALISELLSSGLELNPLSDNYSNWDLEKAKKDVKYQIKKHGIENIELIIANNDDMALGAVAALQEIGYNSGDSSKYVPIFGVDGVSSAINAINNGYMTGTVYADCSSLAATCVHIVKNFDITEKELSSLIYFPVKNHTILIPYQPYAKFKKYTDKK